MKHTTAGTATCTSTSLSQGNLRNGELGASFVVEGLRHGGAPGFWVLVGRRQFSPVQSLPLPRPQPQKCLGAEYQGVRRNAKTGRWALMPSFVGPGTQHRPAARSNRGVLLLRSEDTCTDASRLNVVESKRPLRADLDLDLTPRSISHRHDSPPAQRSRSRATTKLARAVPHSLIQPTSPSSPSPPSRGFKSKRASISNLLYPARPRSPLVDTLSPERCRRLLLPRAAPRAVPRVVLRAPRAPKAALPPA